MPATPRTASENAETDPEAPGGRDEWYRTLWRAARKGNVPAMRIIGEVEGWLGTQEAPKSESVIDELARRREAN